MDIEGQLMRGLFEQERLKPAILHMESKHLKESTTKDTLNIAEELPLM